MSILRNIAAVLTLAAATLTGSAFTTDTITVAGPQIPKPMRVTVITPQGAVKADSLPVVYLLNGYGGDYRSWGQIRPDLGKLADRYRMVLVSPSGMDSWYWDAPADSTMQMESFFVETLVPHIDKHYPVSTDTRKRAITGLSMGGHGGLWLGTRHPEIWGNMGSTSGGVNILPFPGKWKIANALGERTPDNEEHYMGYTVVSLVPQMAANGQNIIFDCGADDFFHDVNADLHARLLEAKVPHDYISRPGKHNWAYWANSILYQLLYFDSKFQQAK